MNLTIYDTLEEFKSNYLNDFDDKFDGNKLKYLKAYQKLYEDILLENDSILGNDAIFDLRHKIEAEQGVLLDHNDVYKMQLPILRFELNKREAQHYIELIENEYRGEVFNHVVHIVDEIEDFLIEEIDREQRRLDIMKAVLEASKLTELSREVHAPAEPAKDEWEVILDHWLDEHKDEANKKVNFGWLYRQFINDKLFDEVDMPINKWNKRMNEEMPGEDGVDIFTRVMEYKKYSLKNDQNNSRLKKYTEIREATKQ